MSAAHTPRPYRVLVADDLAPEGLAILQEVAEVEVRKGMDEATLMATLPGYHALVVRSATTVTARSLEGADQLAVVGRAGIGVDNIDVEAATARGIAVMNTPDAGATTTAEHAISLLLSMTRNIAAADASVKAGKWEKSAFVGVELQNKVFGVIGLGRIGRLAAERGVGLGMEVVAYDPHVSQKAAPAGVRMLEFNELLRAADFVTVHVPLLDATRDLLDANSIARMKKGARLVHAARGGIVNEQALADALTSGHLAGAAVDVFTEEPLPADHPLRSAPNVILTPHLGASTKEAKANVSIDMARQIALCLTRGIILNGVNVPRVAPSEALQVAPYMDLCHNLAGFLTQVFDGPIESLRLTVQGGMPASAQRPLTVAMIAGALNNRRPDGAAGPVTAVNAERVAEEAGVRTHCETSSLKRDFMNLLRVEALIGGERHFVSGTVLGQRHGRMVELDDYLLDAILDGSMLVTFHEDKPGVLGKLCTVLGERGVNIDRMQLGPAGDDGVAVGILNLSAAIDGDALSEIAESPAVQRAFAVEL